MTLPKTIAPWILLTAVVTAVMQGLELLESGIVALWINGANGAPQRDETASADAANATQDRDEDETELEPDPA